FFSSRRRHTSFSRDWSSDVCSSDLGLALDAVNHQAAVLWQTAGLLEQVGAVLQHHRHPLAAGLVDDGRSHQTLADAAELVEADVGLAVLACDNALDRYPLDQASLCRLLRAKPVHEVERDRKSTRLNSSHVKI